MFRRHLGKGGFEHLSEIIQARGRFACPPEIHGNRPRHEIVVGLIKHIVQSDIAQEEFLVVPVQGLFNGAERIRRRFCMDTKIPKETCKQDCNAEQYEASDLYLCASAHHADLLSP